MNRPNGMTWYRKSIIALRILALVFTCLFACTSFAMPPNVYKGVQFPVFLESENSFRMYTQNEFNEKVKNNIQYDMANSRGPVQRHCPTFLVDFSDNKHQVDNNFFDYLLNDHNMLTQYYPDTRNITSVKGYYIEESGNCIELTFDVYDWIEAPEIYSYYVNNEYGMGSGSYPNNVWKLFEDVVYMMDDTVDFSQYDYDDDGYCDYSAIIHSGPGAETTGKITDIWSHQSSNRNIRTNDGVNMSLYSIQPEYQETPNDGTIGVFCHEFGHLIFGLVDLYDTDYTSYGYGNSGLMSYGSFGGIDTNRDGSSPTKLSAMFELLTGFKTCKTLTDESSITLHRGEIFKIPHPYLSREYLLINFPEKTSYNNSLLTTDGLIIEHVNEIYKNNKKEWYPEKGDPNETGTFYVSLVQKDGLYQLEKRKNKGDPGDYFYDGDSLLHDDTNILKFRWYHEVTDEDLMFKMPKIDYNQSTDSYTLYFSGEIKPVEVKPYKIITINNNDSYFVIIKTKDDVLPEFIKYDSSLNVPSYFKHSNGIYSYKMSLKEVSKLFVNKKSLLEYLIGR